MNPIWFQVAAVLLSPLIAVQVTQRLNRRKEKRDRQRALFRALMATRASPLATEHVQALNMIDVEFHGERRARPILEAWKAYLDHLGTPQGAAWGQRQEDLLVDLLYAMAKFLAYDFDRTHIRRHSYFPIGYGNLELEAGEIRQSVLAVLRGERAIHVTGDPPAALPGWEGPSQLPPAPKKHEDG